MVEAMELEMDLRTAEFLDKPKLGTLYFGGGTPSILPQKLLGRIFNRIEARFDLGNCKEITLEANPDDTTVDNLRFWKSLGINRLSIGLQSFNDQRLIWMNRNHTSQMGIQAVKTAQDFGIDNLTLDLLYNLPNSTMDELNSDLRQLLSLEPRHISAYGLTVEPKTFFENQVKKGLLLPLPEESASQQYHLVSETLQQAGFDHYEVSNFGQPGFHSQHNTNYWFQVPYFGIGPGAHGYDGNIRYSNLANNPGYIRQLLQNKKLAETQEILSPENRANEMILIRLRTQWGLNLDELKAKTGYDLAKDKKYILEQWQREKLIKIESNVLLLNPSGKVLADHLALELMLEA